MTAESVWLAPATALGGALVGGVFVLLGGWRQRRAEQQAARRTAQQSAYAQLLAASAMVVHTADTLRLTKSVRSGLKEGLDVTTRVRTPADPMELYTFVRRDFEPLYAAWAEVWAVGSPDAVRLANDILNRAGTILEANTQKGERRRGLMWWLAGEAWTEDQLDQIRADVTALAHVRRELGELARRELGVEAADLFASSLP